jgi:hypothetical protein
MTLRKGATAIFSLCLASMLCFFALRHYYYIMFSGQRTSDPEFVIYRLDDAHRLLVGSDAALLINTQEKVVLSLSPSHGRRMGAVVLWRRDATRGVVLGDGVKGDVGDSFHFVDGGVDIRYGSATAKAKRELHVTL